MNIFELCYNDWDAYSPYLFTHPTKTPQEFEKDVKNCFKCFGKDYLKQEKCFAGVDSWTSFVASKLPLLGYIKIKNTGTVITSGTKILEKNDHDDGTENFLEEFITPELTEAAYKHNANIRKES